MSSQMILAPHPPSELGPQLIVQLSVPFDDCALPPIVLYAVLHSAQLTARFGAQLAVQLVAQSSPFLFAQTFCNHPPANGIPQLTELLATSSARLHADA